MTNTLQFAEALIRRPSVTPDDAGCQNLLAERLKSCGFRLETLQFGEVTNLWARRGSAGPVFCFAGHTDVVPPGPLEEWHSDPFDPVVRNEVLYGRGAADMKASLAAMIDATTQFVTANPRHQGSIAFLITSDEEGRARDGTLKVMETLQSRGENIDWCLIGEPSCAAKLGDTLRVGRRGSLSGMLTVKGQQGHVAYPQLADNPIQRFAPVLAELYAEELDQGNDYFPPSSFQVVELESGAGAPNVTPASLYARFNFRYSTQWDHHRLQAAVEERFRRHKLDFDLNWHLSGEPFLTPPGTLIDEAAAAVTQVTGVEPELSTGGGTSDGRFIAPSGTHVVEFGALNHSIHKVNEEIPIAHIDMLCDTYRVLLERLLS